jgi:adenosylmethionine-8-amino-7-oxononanoate aminotransferase
MFSVVGGPGVHGRDAFDISNRSDRTILEDGMDERAIAAWIERDRAYVIHPLHHPNDHTRPLLLVKGDGATVTDAAGKTYLDGLAALWNVNVGHGRTELAEAAARQMRELAYHSNYIGGANLAAIELAERLVKLASPNMQAAYFTCGGAESNESSIKTARHYWRLRGRPEKTKVISRLEAYHGVTTTAASATGMSIYWPTAEPRSPGFFHAAPPYPYRSPFGPDPRAVSEAAAADIEDIIQREGPETIAAVIGEPVMGAGGVIPPDASYWPRVRQICDQYEVLLIADEVITGFGRTGRWFAMEHWGVEPDLMSVAKGITSGYQPLGAMVVSRPIAEALNSAPYAQRWMHAYTYSGHPTCCAVALANLDIIEREGLVARAEQLGDRLLAGLRSLAGLETVGDVRGLGLMAAVELVEDRASKEPLAAAAQVRLAALEQGLIIRQKGSILMMAPPLVISEAQIDQMVSILGDAIATVGHGAKQPVASR